MSRYKTKFMNLQLFAGGNGEIPIEIVVDEDRTLNVYVYTEDDFEDTTWEEAISFHSQNKNLQFTKDSNGLIKFNGYQLYYGDTEVKETDSPVSSLVGSAYSLSIALTETTIAELSKFPMTFDQYRFRKPMIPETAIPVITDIDEKITGIDASIKNLETEKQNVLVSGENIKTVNGSSLVGAGNVAIRTYQPFPSSWSSAIYGTTEDFCNTIDNDASAIEGMTYLGELRLSDFHENGIDIYNGEALVEIFVGSVPGEKVIHITLSSGNVEPYKWECTYWNGGDNFSGWIAFQTKLDIATSSTAGIVKLGNNTIQTIAPLPVTTFENRTYAIQKNSNGQLVVNVPWADNNTEYNILQADSGGTAPTLVTTGDKYIWNGKSVVSASQNGTSNLEIKYLTINGTEMKIGDSNIVNGVAYEEI